MTATRRCRSERGQVTVMIVLFTICLILVIVAVTDVSASYLRKQAATALADGSALAATDAAAAASVYGSPADRFVPLDPDAASAAVDTYLRQTGAYRRYPGLVVAVDVRGHVVTVGLAMPYTLPVPVPGVDRQTTIHATSSAELPIYSR